MGTLTIQGATQEARGLSQSEPNPLQAPTHSSHPASAQLGSDGVVGLRVWELPGAVVSGLGIWGG